VATTILSTPEDTIAFGRAVSGTLEAGAVLALCGELGSGKTHFVKGLAEGLDAKSEATSPTFTLIHEYLGGRLPLYHVDWYRLDDAAELAAIGFDDCLAGNGVVAVEWADKFPASLPPDTHWLRFRYREDGTREVSEE
jgi:tRNA threonylcarbamoyladenosine biosynthesis protein TsaE